MRSTFFFAALLVAVAFGVLLAVSDGDRGRSGASRGTITLVGDSLNVGIEPYLAKALPGWKVVANDRVGRSTPEGVAEVEARRPALSTHVVVSLGTNDPPGAAEAFRSDVERLLELAGPNRCVVWATIWRDGSPDDAFNAVLRDAAAANQRVRVVEWASMVDEHPEWLAPDGLHGNETGYRERAREVADAAKGCAPAQTVSG